MITDLRQLEQEIAHVRQEFSNDTRDSEAKRAYYLGKTGTFNSLAACLKTLLPQNRKEAGKQLNELKEWMMQQLGSLEIPQPTSLPDPTFPGLKIPTGHMHPISHAINDISKIFGRIGFTRVRYPEIDGSYYVFESLNMPKDHPANDEFETFYIDMPEDKRIGKIVLSTHTSNGWVHEMDRLGSKPPIRMINIARVYRRQSDVTHTPMFHQFEGLVIDKGINIQHLKGTIDFFAREFYGPKAKSRIRPFHFQFTEPSFEVDFSCTICNGTGYLDHPNNTVRCRFCKSGWHEVGGAGMVHPSSLVAGGIDPNVYSGFAFGWGIERTYTLQPGLHIDDIRLLYNGDLRFLEQF